VRKGKKEDALLEPLTAEGKKKAAWLIVQSKRGVGMSDRSLVSQKKKERKRTGKCTTMLDKKKKRKKKKKKKEEEGEGSASSAQRH